MWQKVLELTQTLVEWFKQVGPTAVSVGMIVFNMLNRRLAVLRLKVKELELALKYKDNERRVKELNKNKSDLDIVNDAISEGKRIADGKPDDGHVGDGDNK